MRQQSGVLHDIPDAATEFYRVAGGDVSAVDRDCPDDGSTIRLIMRSSVVLPQPDEPTRTVVVRDGIVRLKPSTARAPPANCLLTDSNSIIKNLSRRRRGSHSLHSGGCLRNG